MVGLSVVGRWGNVRPSCIIKRDEVNYLMLKHQAFESRHPQTSSEGNRFTSLEDTECSMAW